MIAILAISFVAAATLIVWMVFTAYKRRWRKLIVQFTFCAVFFAGIFAVFSVHRRNDRLRYYEGLFQTKVDLPAPLFYFDSPRHFNGDGYSIDVYSLPKEIRVRFERFDEAELGDYPRRPDYRMHWKVASWHRTPALKDDMKYVDFALHFGASDEVTKIQKAVRDCVAQSGSYLAYFYQDHGERTENVDLFVVDLAGDRLYLVNLNI